MKILSLYIEKYKKFENQNIIFNSDSQTYYQHDIFNAMNITLFCGENGSGKTTILSFIAKIFRYIQRYRERIPCDFTLKYIINIQEEEHFIVLSKLNRNITISIDDINYYIMEYNIRKRSYVYNPTIYIKQVTYEDIKLYLPNNILVLGFDVDYNGINYSHNYIGDRLVNFKNIEYIYASSGIGADFSLGILNTLLLMTQDIKVENVFKSMGFQFAPFVDVFFNFSYHDWNSDLISLGLQKKHFSEEFWNHYIYEEVGMNSRINLSILFEHKEIINILKYFISHKYIYINEFYIIKNSAYISINGMSTGEKAFLYELFFIVAKIQSNTIIIWEEPETHLNKLWATQLIPLLAFMFKKDNVHFLLSSHETTLINCLFPNQIVLLREADISSPDFQTFLANENEIMYNLYERKTYNIFENYMIEKINSCNKKELNVLLENIGESFLKFLIYQQLNK